MLKNTLEEFQSHHAYILSWKYFVIKTTQLFQPQPNKVFDMAIYTLEKKDKRRRIKGWGEKAGTNNQQSV